MNYSKSIFTHPGSFTSNPRPPHLAAAPTDQSARRASISDLGSEHRSDAQTGTQNFSSTARARPQSSHPTDGSITATGALSDRLDSSGQDVFKSPAKRPRHPSQAGSPTTVCLNDPFVAHAHDIILRWPVLVCRSDQYKTRC